MEEYEKLPKEFKTKWTSALRSGEYIQETGCLSRDGGYCCLGVAAVVAGHQKTIDKCDPMTMSKEQFRNVPLAIKCDVNVTNDLVAHLTNMNDAQHKTFSQIADWIEENL